MEEKLVENLTEKADRESMEVVSMFFDRKSECLPLHAATNTMRMNGAGVILYPGFLKKFAEKMGDDLYILPSSIHEVLLLPASYDVEVEFLKEMVSQINREEVLPEERLSDSVYFYDRKTDRVEIV